MNRDGNSRRLRVLVLTSTLPRWTGDPEPRFVLDLARSLATRFEITILAPQSPAAAEREIMEGIDVRRFRYAPFQSWERLATPGAILPNLRARPWLTMLIPALFLGELIAVLKILREQNFDVVHCHWIIPQGLVFCLASLLVKAPPFLLTCHGADAFTLNHPPMRWIKRWILRRAGAITVVSREISSFLEDRIDPSVRSRLQHIPMGVDIELFQPCSDRLSSQRPIILFVGRLSEKKGVENLIHALTTKGLAEKELELRIVGDGPLRARLSKLTSELGISRKVTFVGSIPHSKLCDEFSRATIFCAPSIVTKSGDREGTPTVVLEAAAAMLPIVASNVGGCSDVIQNGCSGWLVPPGDRQALATAIVDSLNNPGKAAKMAVGAHQRVHNFSWSRIGARYAEVLEDLVSGVSYCRNERAI